MKSILVYCGANEGNKPIYKEKARALGSILVKKNIRLVYGGGSVGLMGVVADTMLEAGGYVIGVIPDFLIRMEVGHKGLTELHTVESMHERKALMEKLTDGIMAIPGGFGTFDELFEILTWAQLGLHEKPIGILNVNGFYDHLLKQIDVMVEEGFLKQENRSLLLVSDDIDDLLQQMENFKPLPTKKWLKRGDT
ncbi:MULTISPECIES: TIGR00730 family Rossman fold protein [Emticicia]|uniref:LOG family protein n=1 Tax=Emticicia TaxID=312278 RepID=UPI00209CB33F|nr:MULTISPECIES: TIGR00730 family Rossman fold protein [Emticicia]UTA68029.1 TIGR00730 family Rossman fold protein [Emticicia sp. 21SJ11W-3]